ncbi:hypothetical protein PTTG_29466 [Puccinia triticina 1-1 BBBD Race 1]|uniref:Uncharacterized protein n=2 Tax=Puccinia triticina TaxID=208348 RepID=A0A180G654_PUCT1|nr:uncharacterized protein PtA15_7A368 [Puccinia triticina]OAV87343.1 hypothetical protein PTTG_29466 [Puccinia triticina 1-1 BBBD Race 1]WAQ86641.1 hypothetical protein PtA15_7A368 [Puccinia triticina]
MVYHSVTSDTDNDAQFLNSLGGLLIQPPSITTLFVGKNYLSLPDPEEIGRDPRHDSEIFLRPSSVTASQFRQGKNVLVLAEYYNSDGKANMTNFCSGPESHHALALELMLLDRRRRNGYQDDVLMPAGLAL